MPQSDKPRVTLVVEPELKERIDEAAETEYGSLAEVVRTAVRHELDVVEEPSQPTEQPQTGLAEEASERLARIEEAVTDANERLQQLESETRGSGPVYDLQKVLYNYVLPTPPEGTDVPGKDDVQRTEERFAYGEWAITVEEIARTIDADESDVETALDRLTDMTGDVKSVHGGPDDKTYWFRDTEGGPA